MQQLIRLASPFGRRLGFNIGNLARKRSDVTWHASKPNCGAPNRRLSAIVSSGTGGGDHIATQARMPHR
jgi:hypothetical protein